MAENRILPRASDSEALPPSRRELPRFGLRSLDDKLLTLAQETGPLAELSVSNIVSSRKRASMVPPQLTIVRSDERQNLAWNLYKGRRRIVRLMQRVAQYSLRFSTHSIGRSMRIELILLKKMGFQANIFSIQTPVSFRGMCFLL